MRAACLALALVLVCAVVPAQAQSWPTKPVRVIVPNSTGSRPDTITRLLTDHLSRAFGRQFLVENNVAGGGLVAAQTASRAVPDGYTLFIGAIDTLATHLFAYKSLPYDPVRDFTPVAMLVDNMAYVIAVNTGVAANSLGELLALARAQPGKISCAADLGSASVIASWLAKATGVNLTLIPYKSIATSTQDLASGRVEMIVIGLSSIAPVLKTGKVRLLAITSQKRFPGLDNLATASETVPGFHAAGWLTLVAPAGTPAPIVQRLNAETDAFLKDPAIVQRLISYGTTTSGAGTPESNAEFMRLERERWGKIMREVGIKPE